MKFNTRIPKALKKYFKKELIHYDEKLTEGKLQDAWRHLERAHIIGQAYPLTHSLVHWKMLLFGIRIKNFKEVIGQIPRLLVGGVKSFVGEIPVGNTGGADEPPLRSMPIEEDILHIFKKTGIESYGA